MELQINKTYNFRKEFCPLLDISEYQSKKRKKRFTYLVKKFL